MFDFERKIKILNKIDSAIYNKRIFRWVGDTIVMIKFIIINSMSTKNKGKKTGIHFSLY